MSRNLSLKKISMIISIALILIAFLFSFGAIHLTNKVSEIGDSWLAYKSHHAEKARLENSLRATLGYGGMIHDFKNYILRKDFKRMVKTERSLGVAQAIVTQYFNLNSTHEEKLALDDIQRMLDNYQEVLESTRENISKGKSSRDIDKLIKIDDELALRGLESLRRELISQYPYYKDKKRKPILASDLRIEMGYGGMIHFFKNYVLRQEKEYSEKTVASIGKIKDIIHQYSMLGTSPIERSALEDILKVVDKYKEKLELVAEGIRQKKSPEAIDALVKVDDTYALRGLTTLDQDIILQIEKESSNLTMTIVDVAQKGRIYAIILVILIIIISSYIFWIFSYKIIHPVKQVSRIMKEMSQGNIDIDLEHYMGRDYEDKTEIGEIDSALHIFKSNEYKRRKAEEKLHLMALSDPLTGLANRNKLDEGFSQMISFAKREKKLLAFMSLDLDKFKPINDEYGHAAGDLILKSVANNLNTVFRETDIVARLGGDEFAIILYGPENIESVEKIAERVIALIHKPVPFGKDMLSVGVSIGIAMHSHEDENNLERIMQNADKALYKAKEAGRNRYWVYDQ